MDRAGCVCCRTSVPYTLLFIRKIEEKKWKPYLVRSITFLVFLFFLMCVCATRTLVAYGWVGILFHNHHNWEIDTADTAAMHVAQQICGYLHHHMPANQYNTMRSCLFLCKSVLIFFFKLIFYASLPPPSPSPSPPLPIQFTMQRLCGEFHISIARSWITDRHRCRRCRHRRANQRWLTIMASNFRIDLMLQDDDFDFNSLNVSEWQQK